MGSLMVNVITKENPSPISWISLPILQFCDIKTTKTMALGDLATFMTHHFEILAMESVFLSVVGSFLSVYLTSACSYDSQCSFDANCCKYTDGRGLLNNGVCLSRTNCDGFCIINDDCLPPERCEYRTNRCTITCFDRSDCQPNHVCEDNYCVEDEGDSFTGTIPIVIVGLAILVACFCGCSVKAHKQRMDQLRNNANTNATNNETTRGVNLQPNGNAETLQMNSPTDESNGQSFDAVARSGPPSYIEVNNDVPEVPPPTYEEAMKASSEALSRV